MRGQLTALIEATKSPNIRLQVIPFAAGGHAAAGGAFTILRFGDQELPDIVYIEQLTSAIYLDKRDDLDYYAVAMERLCVEAEPPERTPDILGRSAGRALPGVTAAGAAVRWRRFGAVQVARVALAWSATGDSGRTSSRRQP